MNRFTKHYVDSFSAEQMSGIAFYACIKADIYEKSINYTKERIHRDWSGRVSDLYPKELVQYFIRKEIKYKGETLNSLKALPEDKFRVVPFKKFTGKFRYEYRLSAYTPVYEDIRISYWMSCYLEEKQEVQIEDAWLSVSKALALTGGGEPSLIREETDQHLYFMRNETTKEIKIGISIHPEIRRDQIRYQVGAPVTILYVHPNGGRNLESHLHKKLYRYRTQGEWFLPAIQVIGEMNGLKPKNEQKELVSEDTPRSTPTNKDHVKKMIEGIYTQKGSKAIIDLQKSLGVARLLDIPESRYAELVGEVKRISPSLVPRVLRKVA